MKRLIVVGILAASLHPLRASSVEAPRLPPQWRSSVAASAFQELVMGAPPTRELQVRLLREGAGHVATTDAEFVFPSRAGDLDGDGKHDLLTSESAGEDATIRARRGTDATELWSVDHTYFASPADVDGDGRSEVLTLSSDTLPSGPGVRPVGQHVALLRPDGTPLWTADVRGATVRLGNPKASAGGDVDYVVALRLIPDATGDGKPDVWVGTLDGAYFDVATHLDVYAYVGRALDGTTGIESGRVVAATVNGLPWVVPSADVSGDGLADAFAISGLSSGTGLLSAHSAQGVTHWRRQIPTAIAYPFVHEISGDAAPDVVLQAFYTGGPSRIAYSGTDGAQLWSIPDNGYIDFAGDVDGDGADDLMRIETPEGKTTIDAVSGRTGAVIWGPVERVAPPGAMQIFCLCPSDITGDGVWDPLVANVVFDDPPVVTVHAVDGRDGTGLWSVALGASDGVPLPAGADADGDGAEDVALASATGAEIVVRVMKGTDFSPVWSATMATDRSPLGFYGDDVSGDADPEIVLAMVGFVDEQFRGAAAAMDRAGRVWMVP